MYDVATIIIDWGDIRIDVEKYDKDACDYKIQKDWKKEHIG